MIELSDEYLRALGRMTANFAILEYNFLFALQVAVSPEQRVGQMLASEMSFPQKVSAFMTIYSYRLQSLKVPEGKWLKEVRDITKVAEDLQLKRNTYSHSGWILSADPSVTPKRIKISAKPKKGLQLDMPEVTVTEINDLADEMNNLTERLQKFWAKYSKQFFF